MIKDLIAKRENLGAFIIPCTIGMIQFEKVVSDLGESINLMPHAYTSSLG